MSDGNDPRIYTDEQRRELLRALASDDEPRANEAAALIRHEARAYARAGRDPAEAMTWRIEITREDAVRIARGSGPRSGGETEDDDDR